MTPLQRELARIAATYRHRLGDGDPRWRMPPRRLVLPRGWSIWEV